MTFAIKMIITLTFPSEWQKSQMHLQNTHNLNVHNLDIGHSNGRRSNVNMLIGNTYMTSYFMVKVMFDLFHYLRENSK